MYYKNQNRVNNKNIFMLNQVIGNVGCNVVGGQYITTSCSTVMHQSIPAA
jgi:hypothetical protein